MRGKQTDGECARQQSERHQSRRYGRSASEGQHWSRPDTAARLPRSSNRTSTVGGDAIEKPQRLDAAELPAS